MGSDLAVRVGDPVVELPNLANAVGASSAAMQRELEWARRGKHRATIEALQAGGVTCDEWSAELREPTEEGIAAAAVAAEDARAVKGAALCAFASETAYVSSRGAVTTPLPSPESLPPLPIESKSEEEEEEEQQGGDVGGLLGDIPSLVRTQFDEDRNED